MIASRTCHACKSVHSAAGSALYQVRCLHQAITIEGRQPRLHTHWSNVHRCGASSRASAALPAAFRSEPGRQIHIKQPRSFSMLICSAAARSQPPGSGSEPFAASSRLGSHTTNPDQRVDVAIRFVSDDVRTMAKAGENLWAVAERCNVSIPLNCGRGDCGSCEMEVKKWDTNGTQGGTSVVRTCIAAVPPGYGRLEIDSMEDDIWGADGFDT